jgi:hypothetical protein
MTQEQWKDIVKALRAVYYFPEQKSADYPTENEHFQTDFVDAYIILLPSYKVPEADGKDLANAAHLGKQVGIKWYPKENDAHGAFDVNLFIHNQGPHPLQLTLLEMNFIETLEIDNFELAEYYKPKNHNYQQYDFLYEEKNVFEENKSIDQMKRELIAGFSTLLAYAASM